MNVSLNAHLEKFVAEAVASGRFKSSSEVVREGLRLLEEREIRIAALRWDIQKGRQSGDPVPYEPDEIQRRGREALETRQGPRG